MTKGINIPIAADASSVIREVKKVPDALDKVIDSLDSVAHASTSTDSATEKALSGVAQSADGAGDKLERRFRDAFDSVKRTSTETSTALGHSIKEGAEEASEGADALKENFQQNAKETAASFDGTMQSAVNGAQGLAAEAFEGFGPAGIAAGLAAGAGIGVVNTFLQNAKEKAQETKQAIADVAGAMIDVGSTKLDAEHVDDTIKGWATQAENGRNRLDDLTKAAHTAGITQRDYVRGLAGDNDALQRSYAEVNQSLQDYRDGYTKLAQDRSVDSSKLTDYIRTHQDLHEALTAAKHALEAQDVTLDKGTKTYREYTQATAAATSASHDAASGTNAVSDSLEASLGRWSAHRDAVQADADAQREHAQASKSAFDAETALGQSVADATETLKQHRKAGLDPSTEAGRANREALSGLASAYSSAADAITAAGGSQDEANKKIADGRQKIDDLAKSLGIGHDDAEKLADQLGLIPTQVLTTVSVTTPDAQIDAVQARLDALARTEVHVPITFDTDAADKQLDAWLSRQRSLGVQVNPRPGLAVPI